MNTVRAQRSPWTIGLFIGFAVVIAVNVMFAVLASRSDVGYIEDHTWDKDQHFQTVLNAEDRFRDSGLSAAITSARQNDTATLELKLVQHGKAAATGWKVLVMARRGDAKASDMPLTLEETSPGIYSVATPHILPGLWLLEITLERANQESLRFHQRVML